MYQDPRYRPTRGHSRRHPRRSRRTHSAPQQHGYGGPVMVPIRVVEYEKKSSGGTTSCIVTTVILSLLAISLGVFLLNFSGIVPFGHDGGVIKRVERGIEHASQCEYNGPWGT